MTPQPLEPCEKLVDDPTELFLRQVNPKHLESSGEVGQAAFVLSSGDAGKLSGARNTKQTPQGACDERHSAAPGRTAGTWALSGEEVNAVEGEHQTGLRLVDDFDCPSPDPVPTGHTYLDMRDYEQLPKNEKKVIRDRLAVAASARGCLARPSPEPSGA